MYAIVKTGGKQYRAEPGKFIHVEKLNAGIGEEVTLNEILLVNDGDNVKVGSPLVANSSIRATVVDQDRGKKLVVFKFKRRKGYRKKQGHRQDYTRLKI